MKKDNVVKFPNKPRTVPESLRFLADEIEKQGGVDCVLACLQLDDGSVMQIATGEVPSPHHLLGILELAKHDLIVEIEGTLFEHQTPDGKPPEAG